MSSSGLNFSPITPTPNMADMLAIFKRQLLLDLNCHALGSIVLFDPTDQTAMVQINYCQTYFEINNLTGVYELTPHQYPLLQDVPVIIAGGGTGNLTFPILPGDQCLLLFNDRDIDNWSNGQYSGQLNSSRIHNISDAIAIVGLHSDQNPISNYDLIRSVLVSGTAAVGVNPLTSQILVTNSYPTNTITLGSTLSGFKTATNNLNTAVELLNTSLLAYTVSIADLSPVTPWETGAAAATATLATALATVTTDLSAVATALAVVSTEIGALLE